MRGKPQPRDPRPGISRAPRVVVTCVLMLLLVGSAAALLPPAAVWTMARFSGHTPDELMAHAQRRLQGHVTLAAAVEPLLGWCTWVLGANRRAAIDLWIIPDPPLRNVDVDERASDARVIDRIRPQRPSMDQTIPVRVGRGARFVTIADAIRAVPDGAVIEIEPGDYVADVTEINRTRLVIRAAGPGVRVHAAGAHSRGMGIWVVNAGDVTVEGVTFIGARVQDRNGAGIRLERGRLTVRRCTFHGNQNGILTSNDEGAELFVEDSEFGFNGAGDGLSHSLYAGTIARLRVVGSYFHHANVGHHIKSRARVSEIVANRIADESGGRASYEVEFPNGGDVRLVGNLLQQGEQASNSTLVSYGAEGWRHPRNRLIMRRNTVVNDHPRGGTMVRLAPGPREAFITNNLWIGRGGIHGQQTQDRVLGNREGRWQDLYDPLRGDYRLKSLAGFEASDHSDPEASSDDLLGYRHPVRHFRLSTPPAMVGAPG